jgi:hypothetical protein
MQGRDEQHLQGSCGIRVCNTRVRPDSCMDGELGINNLVCFVAATGSRAQGACNGEYEPCMWRMDG